MSVFRDKRLVPLISQQKIADRVKELGEQVTLHYANVSDPLVLLGVLKGSVIFLADLVRTIDLPLEMEMIGVSSYGEATTSSGVVRITQDLERPIKHKHVLIVEDIFDTGLTIKYLVDNLASREPKSIKICTLLKKDATSRVDIKPDFIGFTIPDAFVVGYGLDVAERYRNLPMVAIYQP
ncbi:MAG TPA: hypoxanthine phosphoribosyltransferase [Myxococcota bacterium]|nr:hypoxanthine phosphoribosyltransferase [Myxococcota bacterium]